jgi:hypothetical protein
MQHSGHAPLVFVFAKPARVRLHHRFNGARVLAK